MKVLSLLKYYAGMALFILAKNRIEEIRGYERELGVILGSRYSDAAGDAIYDPYFSPTREGWNEFLQKQGIDVDWKGKLKEDKDDKAEKVSDPAN